MNAFGVGVGKREEELVTEGEEKVRKWPFS